jgi:molybdate transport system regulatory protein
MGMSYKHAWDAVDAMNNLSPQPLVQRRTGGRHGGGTELTDEGRRLIAVYETAEREHRKFLARLREGIRDFDRFHTLIGALNMKVSARNNLRGVVASVKPGAVNAEVTLDVGGTPLVAIVTNESVQSLGLAPGVEAYALIKASFVILATEDGGLKTSARNRLCGTVERVTDGAVNTEVVWPSTAAPAWPPSSPWRAPRISASRGRARLCTDQGASRHPGGQATEHSPKLLFSDARRYITALI